MPYFAAVDPTGPIPDMVVGWFNTTERTYPYLPPPSLLHEITSAEWAQRLHGRWLLKGSRLVQYAPEATPGELRLREIAKARDAGLTINCPSAPDMDGTYPVDNGILLSLSVLIAYIGAAHRLPRDVSAWPVTDVLGVPRHIPMLKITDLFMLLVDYASALDLAETTTDALPPASVTIP